MSAAERHRLQSNGVELAMSVTGSGPDLLFVHGLGSAQVMWEPFIAQLAETHRCWNLDLRGHGESGRAGGAYDAASYASDVAVALDHIAGPALQGVRDPRPARSRRTRT